MQEVTIADIVSLAADLTQTPRDHRALVNGCLLVTPQQYDTLRDYADDLYWEEQEYLKPQVEPKGAIPVIIVYPWPDRPPVAVGDKYAVNVMDRIYVFNKSHVPEGMQW